jgi:hypothetical protein
VNQRDGRDIRFGGLDDAIDAAVAGVGQVSDLFQNVLKLCDIIKRYVDKSVGAVVGCRCSDVLNGELAAPEPYGRYIMIGGIDIAVKVNQRDTPEFIPFGYNFSK